MIYTGAAPNQQAMPAVDYLIAEGVWAVGPRGTDYAHPRTTNKISKPTCGAKGAPRPTSRSTTRRSAPCWQARVAAISASVPPARRPPSSRPSGDANAPASRNQKIGRRHPGHRVSVGEEELAAWTPPLVVTWPPELLPERLEPGNTAFINQWKT